MVVGGNVSSFCDGNERWGFFVAVLWVISVCLFSIEAFHDLLKFSLT